MGRSTTYNNIVSDELWEQVNKENKILLNDFIDYKRSTKALLSYFLYGTYRIMTINSLLI